MTSSVGETVANQSCRNRSRRGPIDIPELRSRNTWLVRHLCEGTCAKARNHELNDVGGTVRKRRIGNTSWSEQEVTGTNSCSEQIGIIGVATDSSIRIYSRAITAEGARRKPTTGIIRSDIVEGRTTIGSAMRVDEECELSSSRTRAGRGTDKKAVRVK